MLAELLNDIIDFSKIEAGKLELNPEPVDPGALLAQRRRPAAPRRPRQKGLDAGRRGRRPASAGSGRRPPPAAPGPVQPGGQRREVHPGGRRPGAPDQRRSAEASGAAALRDPATAAWASTQAAQPTACSSASARPTARPPAASAARAWAWRSPERLAVLMGGDGGLRSLRRGRGLARSGWRSPRRRRLGGRPRRSRRRRRPPCWPACAVLMVEDNATNRLIAGQAAARTMGAVVETADDGVQGVEVVERAAELRPHLDGRPDARHGRARGHAAHPRPGRRARLRRRSSP